MSVRLRLEPPLLVEPAVDPADEPPLLELEEDPPLELVEYFVEVLELAGCLTSVPKSVQFEHTSSSAPSTLMVFGDDVSAPHISH
ncbi:Transcription factor MBF1 [Natrarchaeobaculum sulfurireducens]|uniref:Transcription factor MBF1 n=1 Tax=Natrarchaeobaculum sulfurireducens TaxID=2044521 RepID=A0A346PE27_9EURY|nr:Transcription factor MBF1 [Natrarchaeobaculum sulfurireducens]